MGLTQHIYRDMHLSVDGASSSIHAPALSERLLTLPPLVLRLSEVPYETWRQLAVSLLRTCAERLAHDTSAVQWPVYQSHFRQTRTLQIAAATLG